MYQIRFTKQTDKDIILLKRAKLDGKVRLLLDVIAVNPLQSPPPFEKLQGDLQGSFSRRINSQHRLVYGVYDNTENLLSPDGTPYDGVIKVIRMWTHYE